MGGPRRSLSARPLGAERVLGRACAPRTPRRTERSTNMDLLTRLLEAKIDWGPGVYWREIVGNVFGLAGAPLRMRRRVSAWPVGIIGNVLLFTVFIGGALGGPFDESGKQDLWGQAARQ